MTTKKSALSSTQEFLNIQNSGFLPSQHLLISRYSAVLFQTPHIIENLSRIETTYCDCLSLFSSFFFMTSLKVATVSSLDYVMINAQLGSETLTSLIYPVTIFLLMYPRPVFTLLSYHNTLMLQTIWSWRGNLSGKSGWNILRDSLQLCHYSLDKD